MFFLIQSILDIIEHIILIIYDLLIFTENKKKTYLFLQRKKNEKTKIRSTNAFSLSVFLANGSSGCFHADHRFHMNILRPDVVDRTPDRKCLREGQ